jgi:hypothetical protein
MRVNPRHWLASSPILWFVATACTSGPSTSDDGRGGGGDAGMADAGTGGTVAPDAGTSGAGAEPDSATQADGSVADSGTGTSEAGDAGVPNAATDGGPQGTEIVVWNGEDVNPVSSSWANPTGTCSTAAQTAESHSQPTAVQFSFNVPSDPSADWLGGGWDWVDSVVGPYGTDVTSMTNFTFWLKTEGQVAELSFNLLCNGAPALDQPQHHTGKVVVSTYSPQWDDGNWHQISVPLADLTQPAGFDAQHVAEFQFFNTGAGDGSFFIDDIAFNDAP